MMRVLKYDGILGLILCFMPVKWLQTRYAYAVWTTRPGVTSASRTNGTTLVSVTHEREYLDRFDRIIDFAQFHDSNRQ